MLGSNEVPDSPAGGVEGFPGRTNGKGAFVEFWGHGSDSCEGDVEQAVVDFVGQDDEVMLHAEVADALQFGSGEDFPDGVMAIAGVSGVLHRNLDMGVHTVSSGPGNVRLRNEILVGLLTIIFVLELMVFSSSSKSIVHSDAGEVLVAPSLGG